MISQGFRQMPQDLRDAIAACGYFPEVITGAIAQAVGGEDVLHHLVHHEATFDHEELRRHLSVLVLTATRLIVGHTDEGEGVHKEPQAITTTESVALSRINSVSLTQVVTHPERHSSSQPSETWLTVGWGAMRRLDLEAAHCGDPQCEADHGFSGALVADDLTVRMSVTADGAHNVARLVDFATTLQLATRDRS